MNLLKKKKIFTLLVMATLFITSFPLQVGAECSCCIEAQCTCNCTEKSQLQEKFLHHQDHAKSPRCINCWETPARELPAAGIINDNPLHWKQLLTVSSHIPLMPFPFSPHETIARSTQLMPYQTTPLYLLKASFLL